MYIRIKLRAGPEGQYQVTKREIQKNIDALERAIKGKMNCSDTISLMDTKTILRRCSKTIIRIGGTDANYQSIT